jgi:hypothetical protein
MGPGECVGVRSTFPQTTPFDAVSVCVIAGSITTMSSMLNSPLRLWLTQVEFDSVGTESPYLFYQSGDPSRNLPSGQWTQLVKSIFQKHAGVPCPPKLLRASFITWLRDSTDAPSILKAAAKVRVASTLSSIWA